jgi:NTE family protein
VRELGADTVIGVCAIPEVCKAPAETYLPPAEEENQGGKGHPFEFFNAARVESILKDILGRNGNGKKTGKENSQRKPPSLFRVCAQSVVIMENQINQLRLERNDIDLLIRPDLKSIGLLDFHRAGEAIQAGETAAASVIDRLRALTGNH